MWIIYALLSAFFVATTDPIAKKALKFTDEYIIGWAMIMATTPFLAVFCFSRGAVALNAGLIKTVLAAMPFEVAAAILYYKAFRWTDISLSVPFLALTPVFTILTGFLVLGERVRPLGAAGILLITIGAYSLKMKGARFINRGSFYMVLVALIFSITSVISKKAMLYASPESIPFIYNLSFVIAMAPIAIYRLAQGRSRITDGRKAAAIFLSLGILSAISSICHFKAMSLTDVAYAISIKRLSLLMSVFYGWLFFRERDIRVRFLSALCMFAGVVLIAISK